MAGVWIKEMSFPVVGVRHLLALKVAKKCNYRLNFHKLGSQLLAANPSQAFITFSRLNGKS